MKTIKELATSFGLSLGIFLVIYGLIFRLFQLSHDSLWTWGFYLAIPLFVFLWYRELPKGSVEFKNTFLAGLRLVLFGTSLYVVFVYLYNKFIDDSLLSAVLEEGLNTAREQGLTGASLQTKETQLQLLTSPEVFSVLVFIQLLAFGALVAAVFGLMAKHAAAKIKNH